MRLMIFGTYDEARHPRVAVLREGFTSEGVDVIEVNARLGDTTAARVQAASNPLRTAAWVGRLTGAWARLLWRSRSAPAVDAVVVGYLGVLDVLLARMRWPRATLVLDHMAPLRGIADDRRVGRIGSFVMSLADRIGEAAADVVIFDTEENRALSSTSPDKTLVVPVGAQNAWFGRGAPQPAPPLRVVFFGLFTPLQGTPVIGEAIRSLAGRPVVFTIIGGGQDFTETVSKSGDRATVIWIDWVAPDDLPALVSDHHVCLGIFGTTAKASRVVPNKVFQGAAAGCALVTLDSEAQREVLGDAAIYVPAGDPVALAAALELLSEDVERLADLRDKAQQVAGSFTPAAVVRPLLDLLRARTRSNMRSQQS